jgi:hypothetical protein
MEAVHELKSESDQQRNGQQNVSPRAGTGNAAQIVYEVNANEPETDYERSQDNPGADHGVGLVHFLVKQRGRRGPDYGSCSEVGHAETPNFIVNFEK